ncbi:MAG: YlbG family protein [Clostridia bacterium]
MATKNLLKPGIFDYNGSKHHSHKRSVKEDEITNGLEKKIGMENTRERRYGVAVWIKNPRVAKHLRKYGSIHFVSKRLNYVSMYVDADAMDNTIRQMEKLPFVTRVERSYRHEIPTTYNNAKPDKAKEFDYHLEKTQLIALTEMMLGEPVVDNKEKSHTAQMQPS